MISSGTCGNFLQKGKISVSNKIKFLIVKNQTIE